MTKLKKKTEVKPKRNHLKNEPEVFWYLNAKGEEMWGFRHRYYDTFGNRREKPRQGLASKNVAIRELLQVKTDLINGNLTKVDNSNLTVSEWLDVWYKEHSKIWAVSTNLRRRGIIDEHIKPLIGKNKLVELDRATYVNDFIDVLLKSYKVSTVYTYHNLFRIAVNAAVENESIPRNRFRRVLISDGVEKNDELENFLTADELKEFLTYAKANEDITSYTGALFLAYTGLRKGEMSGLYWSDIDFENKELTVDRTRDKLGIRPPKTKRSYRTISISDKLITQLKIYRNWCRQYMFFKGKKMSDDAFIFINTQANPVGDSYFNKVFNRVAEGTGIKRITPHGMRHTHATILLTGKERTPVAVIAKRLGNTPQMINNVYGHVGKDAEVESVASFDSALNL